jgi:superfamily II DNA helicase RecQ
MEAVLVFIKSIQLQPFQYGIVYIRSYEVGQAVSEALGSPFYKAKAYNKATVLQDWVQCGYGWIVATGALGTGVNMPGIVYIIHVDRPYGMTSFVQ